MPEFMYELKIPKGRIAVLIGTNGEIKKQIEEETNTKINIDSQEGDVSIVGDDGLGLYSAREVVTAIGRGFNPHTARLLLKGDHIFEQLDLSEAVNTKAQFIRLKGRIIGAGGKCRKLIEELSDVSMTIYGKTIGIIGEPQKVAIARKAIDLLIRGSMHSTVYRWLEKRRKQLRQSELIA